MLHGLHWWWVKDNLLEGVPLVSSDFNLGMLSDMVQGGQLQALKLLRTKDGLPRHPSICDLSCRGTALGS